MRDSALGTAYDCAVVHFPRIENRAGNITPLEANKDLPFPIARVYYLYDVPGGSSRGGHAHKALHQAILAASGSFDVQIDDGRVKRTITLNRPYYGLHVVPGIWRELTNFSSGSVCLVIASMPYEAADYIRDYDEFLAYRRTRGNATHVTDVGAVTA